MRPAARRLLVAGHAGAEWFDDATTVTLRAGSVLYVPAGMWHRVECVEDSVSLNVSLIGTTWAEFVPAAIRQRLLCHAHARAHYCIALN